MATPQQPLFAVLFPTAAAAQRFASRPREGTKAERLIEMLKRPRGVTADEVADTFGIQKKSAVSRISVETRKRGMRARFHKGRYRVES